MTSPKSALLLIGSAKRAGESSSEALGGYLMDQLAAQGLHTETRRVAQAMRTPARIHELLETVDHSDLLILAFPLYVDSLPALATEALERIAHHRQTEQRPPAAFLAIANCGFPEAAHNTTALAICRQFADAAGFAWAGGLALGEGGALAGQPLTEAGGMVRNVRSALDRVAAALAAGEPVPAQAAALMARPLIPARAYVLMGNLGWLQQARRHRALTRLTARPLLRRTRSAPRHTPE